jgi:F-box protein 21
MAAASLSGLPDEILGIILRFTDPLTSLSLEKTSQRFRDVANEPLLWRFYCQKSFDFWDSRHDIPGKLAGPATSVDWKQLYIARRGVNTTTTKTLNSILESQVGRIDNIHSIVNFGYDAKDTLLLHARAGPDREDYLARRFVFPCPKLVA